MKSVRIAGLCLVSMLALSSLSMVTAGSASAIARWLQCRTATGGEPPTEYTNADCAVAQRGGGWQWRELLNTEQILTFGTLELKDTKTTLGESAVVCGGTDNGWIGVLNKDFITSISVKASNCKAVKVCENVEGIEARNLPWQTELFETEGKVRDAIRNSGAGNPGWKVTCKAPIIGSTTDECTSNEGNTAIEELSGNLSLDFRFQGEKSGKATCSKGGAGSGLVEGTVLGRTCEGWAIKVN